MHVVPSVTMWELDITIHDTETTASIFTLVQTYGFGTDAFVTGVNSMFQGNPSISIESMYRLAGLLVLVDQRKKMQFLTQGRNLPTTNKYYYGVSTNRDSNRFVPVADLGRKTRRELRAWKKQQEDGNPEFLTAFETKILGSARLDSLLNVMTVIEGNVAFDSGDLIMLFNDCGNFFGCVYAYVDARNEQKMIGIRASISRILNCHTISQDQCLVGQLGTLLYSVRCILAQVDGYDTVRVESPIGHMSQIIPTLPPEIRRMMSGHEPFNDTSFKNTFLSECLRHVQNIYIPTWRHNLNIMTIRRYVNTTPPPTVLALKEILLKNTDG